MDHVIGVIGGSGLYEIPGLAGEWRTVSTPWGDPSDALFDGRIGDARVVFLPRHGRGHRLDPASVPYRANVAAMKAAGVTHLVSVSACGSFREEMAPGHVVVVDQFIDRTVARDRSFFGPGCVAHVPFAHPTCAAWSHACADAARAAGATVHEGGTYLAMEGPQFSTAAESRLHRDSYGCAVVGMTNMPEARLAREAELHYCTMAMVTDYDAWHPDHDAVDVAQVVATLRANVDLARRAVAGLLEQAVADCGAGCANALDHAVITAPDARDAETVDRLRTILGPRV